MGRRAVTTTISKLISKLRNPEYRKAYVASQITVGIPFQIKALQKSRDWTQTRLGDLANMAQPRISKLLNPGEEEPNIRTLRRIAEAFDCGLMVSFVPFSELVLRSERFDPESFSVPTFQHECDNGTFDRLGSFLSSDGIVAIDQSVYDEDRRAVRTPKPPERPERRVKKVPQHEHEPSGSTWVEPQSESLSLLDAR